MRVMTSTPTVRKVSVPKTWDTRMWQFMRWSGVLLIPLAWGHILIKDVVIGVHEIDLEYVRREWATWYSFWRIYDAALLAFAFAHGMNGLRHITNDFIHNENAKRVVSWAILIAWFVISAIGATAIIGGVR